MKAPLIIACISLLKGLFTFRFLSKESRRNQVDPKAVEGVRLTPEGSGWMYEYGWPKRRKKKNADKHQ